MASQTVQCHVPNSDKEARLSLMAGVSFLWGKFGYKSRVCCRGDLIGSLSHLDVVPLGRAQWHSVLVIIFSAATVRAVVGSALKARWSSTLAPSTVALRVRPVASN